MAYSDTATRTRLIMGRVNR